MTEGMNKVNALPAGGVPGVVVGNVRPNEMP